MDIYVAKNGETTGPYTLDQIKANVKAGLFKGDDLCWHEGMPDWVSISSLGHAISPVSASLKVAEIDQVKPAKLNSGWVFLGNRKWNWFESIIIYFCAFLFPLAGLLIGIFALINQKKRKQGIKLICISIVLFLLYAWLFKLRIPSS